VWLQSQQYTTDGALSQTWESGCEVISAPLAVVLAVDLETHAQYVGLSVNSVGDFGGVDALEGFFTVDIHTLVGLVT
jgi:hypothetical protein